jgi:hypothetical protein
MKYESVRILALAAAVAAVTLICVANPAAAQAESRQLKANIPFDFHVGARSFPAGTYTVRLIANTVIQVQDQAGKAWMTEMTLPIPSGDPNANSRLVFARYGRDHFLSQVLWRGYDQGQGLIKSSLEREVAKNSIETQRAVAASTNQ